MTTFGGDHDEEFYTKTENDAKPFPPGVKSLLGRGGIGIVGFDNKECTRVAKWLPSKTELEAMTSGIYCLHLKDLVFSNAVYGDAMKASWLDQSERYNPVLHVPFYNVRSLTSHRAFHHDASKLRTICRKVLLEFKKVHDAGFLHGDPSVQNIGFSTAHVAATSKPDESGYLEMSECDVEHVTAHLFDFGGAVSTDAPSAAYLTKHVFRDPQCRYMCQGSVDYVHSQVKASGDSTLAWLIKNKSKISCGRLRRLTDRLLFVVDKDTDADAYHNLVRADPHPIDVADPAAYTLESEIWAIGLILLDLARGSVAHDLGMTSSEFDKHLLYGIKELFDRHLEELSEFWSHQRIHSYLEVTWGAEFTKEQAPFVDLIAKCLSTKRADRPANVAALLQHPFFTGTATTAVPSMESKAVGLTVKRFQETKTLPYGPSQKKLATVATPSSVSLQFKTDVQQLWNVTSDYVRSKLLVSFAGPLANYIHGCNPFQTGSDANVTICFENAMRLFLQFACKDAAVNEAMTRFTTGSSRTNAADARDNLERKRTILVHLYACANISIKLVLGAEPEYLVVAEALETVYEIKRALDGFLVAERRLVQTLKPESLLTVRTDWPATLDATQVSLARSEISAGVLPCGLQRMTKQLARIGWKGGLPPPEGGLRPPLTPTGGLVEHEHETTSLEWGSSDKKTGVLVAVLDKDSDQEESEVGDQEVDDFDPNDSPKASMSLPPKKRNRTDAKMQESREPKSKRRRVCVCNSNDCAGKCGKC